MVTKITITLDDVNVDSDTPGVMIVESPEGRITMEALVRLDTTGDDAEIIVRRKGEPTVEAFEAKSVRQIVEEEIYEIFGETSGLKPSGAARKLPK